MPDVSIIGPRMRCFYCFANKPKSIKTVSRANSKKIVHKKKAQRLSQVVPQTGIKASNPKNRGNKNSWSHAEGTLIYGCRKRNIENHVLTLFHAEQFKEQAQVIRRARSKAKEKKDKGKQLRLPENYKLSQSEIEDNQLRNFIRSCVIGTSVKSSPRQIYAHIAGGALANGPRVPIYGYNCRSPQSIVNVTVFAGFVLRASLMKLLSKARVIGLFSDAESARNDKLLIYGVHLVLNGYCCPMPLCFALGGVSVTGQLIRDSLIHGVTADNILSGASQLIPELAIDIEDEDVLNTLKKINHLNKYTPIGMKYGTFITKIANSLTDGDSNKHRHTLSAHLRKDQREVIGGDL